MIKDFFLLLLLVYLIAEYFLQGDTLAPGHETKVKAVCFHSLTYLIVSIILVLPLYSPSLFIVALSMGITHGIFAFAKYLLIKKSGKYSGDHKRSVVYFIDQIMHIIVIFIISIIAIQNNVDLVASPWLQEIITSMQLDLKLLIRWIVLILLLLKPANITLKMILFGYKPPENDARAFGIGKSTGAMIGNIERLLMITLIGSGQYAAIGLILTAKSIVRYDRITKDKEFGEYYLLGTLTSTLFVVLAYSLIFQL